MHFLYVCGITVSVRTNIYLILFSKLHPQMNMIYLQATRKLHKL